MRRAAILILLGLAQAGLNAGCITAGALADFEYSQVFQPARYPDGNWRPADLPFENAWFVAEDHTQLHGWYVPHEDPAGFVLFAHGNSGNVSTQAETLRTLHDRHRLSVMTFDYRGYGRSEGLPTESGIVQDARAARAWLARRENIDERDIVLMGHSLGGGVMVELAATDGARGLILANTFTTLPDVAKYHAPILPSERLMLNRLDSLSKIGDYHGPLLQFHGKRDRVIPYRLGKKLFDAANEPKRFVTNEPADHNDPMSDEGREALDAFFASLPKPQTSADDTGELDQASQRPDLFTSGFDADEAAE